MARILVIFNNDIFVAVSQYFYNRFHWSQAISSNEAIQWNVQASDVRKVLFMKYN